jgi:hypothetical protein
MQRTWRSCRPIASGDGAPRALKWLRCVTAQARRSHSGVGHLGVGLVVRCHEPLTPPGPRCRPGGGLERLGGGDTGVKPPAQPGRWVVRSGVEDAPDRTGVSSGAEECPGPSIATPGGEELQEQHCRAPEEDPTGSVARVLLRTEEVVRDPEAGETPPHCLLVPRCQRCVRDVLRDHVRAEPDPHPAPVLPRRQFHSHCLLTP